MQVQISLAPHLLAICTAYAAGCGAAHCDPLWTYDMPFDGLDNSHPAISNGMLYVVGQSGSLYAFHPPTTIAALARPNPALRRPNLALRSSLPRLTTIPDLPNQ